MEVLHQAIQQAGLIEGAKTFSLFHVGSELMIIQTGPACREMKEVRIRGVLMELLAKFIFDKIEERTAKKVAAGEARLKEVVLSEEAMKKGNISLHKGIISDINSTINSLGYPEVTFTAGEKVYTFFFRKAERATVENFFMGLR